MALVRSFREQQARLAAVTPVDDAVRTAATLAALAEFDALVAGGADAAPQVAALATVPGAAPRVTAPPTNVVSLDRQRRWNRVLGAAAAVALVGLVGVAVVNLGSGSSNDYRVVGHRGRRSRRDAERGRFVEGRYRRWRRGPSVSPTVAGGAPPDTSTANTVTTGSSSASPTPPRKCRQHRLHRRRRFVGPRVQRPGLAARPARTHGAGVDQLRARLLVVQRPGDPAQITWRGTPAVVLRVRSAASSPCSTPSQRLVTVDN